MGPALLAAEGPAELGDHGSVVSAHLGYFLQKAWHKYRNGLAGRAGAGVPGGGDVRRAVCRVH